MDILDVQTLGGCNLLSISVQRQFGLAVIGGSPAFVNQQIGVQSCNLQSAFQALVDQDDRSNTVDQSFVCIVVISIDVFQSGDEGVVVSQARSTK